MSSDSLPHRPLPAPLDRPLRLGVLISGGGTTLFNFLSQREAGRLDVEIPIVIASRSGCSGVPRARAAGLSVEVIRPKEYESTRAFSEAVFSRMEAARVDLVTTAGFLSLLEVPDAWRHRVMNIHPSLIPSFCGKGFYGHHVHEAVIARGAKVSGCTVHFADNEYDAGPIILQRCVPVLDDDSPGLLAARVFTAECEAYPDAIRLFAAGRLEVEGRRTRILP